MLPSLSAQAAGLPARERILETAHTLFYREGIRATGIDRVIAESGVAKVTFYRHFPSKNELVMAFLELRHGRWMAWFNEALRRHGAADGKGAHALVPALAEWFGSKDFRGCAFLNCAGELGGALPEVLEAAEQHKAAMTDCIAQWLPASRQRAPLARAIALAVDGAIVHAQFESEPGAALKALTLLLKVLDAGGRRSKVQHAHLPAH